MNYDWQIDLRSRSPTAAAFLPPPLIQEAAWDILLTLRSDDGHKLSLNKLGSMVSVPKQVLNQWLVLLEDGQLITGDKPGFARDLRAVLTPAGRELLDRYLTVTSGLQTGARECP